MTTDETSPLTFPEQSIELEDRIWAAKKLADQAAREDENLDVHTAPHGEAFALASIAQSLVVIAQRLGNLVNVQENRE
ncbi:MAG TPA: hypothetical protein VGH09_12515 [Solirubrobacteraceae bacterium]|jgi:hypothetical protein